MEKTDKSRREVLQFIGGAALSARFRHVALPKFPDDDRKTPDISITPKIALELGRTDETDVRRVKQLGVSDVLMGGPPIPC